jgi:hypothetical protein
MLSSKVIARKAGRIVRSAAKTEQLFAKRQRSENRFSDAQGAGKSKGEIAFAATSMRSDNENDRRGAIAYALLVNGLVGTVTFAEIAKAAGIPLSDVTRANLRYVANNVAGYGANGINLRADLVGFAIEPDFASETVRVRHATSEEKAASLRLARSLGLGKVSGYSPALAPRKAAKGKVSTVATDATDAA